ncbi:hypothetical protein [Dyadobacter sandarakinus]|uniref:Addiction module component n=1 Tax=Dyadobacter sandarakinus TaxID=2747268 RepID=A0ABX7IAY9_9BACT|nr:hypothetical protein [Dyadobacter sandarakinus]QRR03104.1 hypothetical protein HWI92_20400 [Dyadobacter sandarakinus]
MKSNLHALIDSIDNPAVLQAYLILLSREARSNDDFWDALDADAKASIQEGIANFHDGKHVDFFDYMKSTHGIDR